MVQGRGGVVVCFGGAFGRRVDVLLRGDNGNLSSAGWWVVAMET